MNIIQQVKNHFVTQEKAAVAIGVNQSAICQWYKKGKIPASRALKVSELTGIPVENILKKDD